MKWTFGRSEWTFGQKRVRSEWTFGQKRVRSEWTFGQKRERSDEDSSMMRSHAIIVIIKNFLTMNLCLEEEQWIKELD